MNVNDISYLSMSSLLILIIPIIIINYKLKIKINKKIFYSIGRMVIQLSLVGVILQYIFSINIPFINFVYFIFMIIVASFTVIRSCNFEINKFIIPLLLAFIIPNVIVLLFFNGFVIRLENLFNAQYIITIGGMLLGNSLSGNIICINNFYNSIKQNKNEYFYSLALSGNRIEALTPYFKSAVLASVNPTMAAIETIGLVALPGMMTGQILGGAVPLTAIKYQIAIMVAILIARYFSAILSILFTALKAFDDYDILIF
ncbi:ABC transporter permease [Paramaledivibacter caminithermalis]|jgi:putative ABC transport system permease protein|uniref:Putative ABC transport system permease protein n=1 Tax=Paramaledivibacter caminithermalis (strain DSM 15212 / CIP 107654 / DViRD3) TaxID=1121301 RepID=A0A1M6RL65_PARC5|nr:ABC transporter permease [Paramaledivibacter caminithermalis]SHK33087.1 putative ABC transport system permease protein [Paramaledivibacter caminithermalis DSM 15212]